MAAEACECLRQLASDRAAANDQQTIGTFRELEHRLVREIRRVGETSNRRYGWTAPRGDRCAVETEDLRPDDDPSCAGERGIPEEHMNA